MSADADTGTLELLSSFADQLREAGEGTLAMLRGELALDPHVLLPMAAAALVVDRERASLPPADPAILLADRLVSALRRGPGRQRLLESLALVDLGPTMDLDPAAEPAEQVARLNDLFELGLLVDLVDGDGRDTRAALTDLLDRNAALVFLDGERFEALYDAASELASCVDLDAKNRDHPVAIFLDTVLAATDVFAEPSAAIDLEAAFGRALDAAEARLPLWVRWRERLRLSVGKGLDLLAEVCSRPVTAWAATRTLPWPAPRLTLAQRGDDEELNLLLRPGELLLEWVGANPPARASLRSAEPAEPGDVLQPCPGPLPGGRYWRLAAPGSASRIELSGEGLLPWSIPLDGLAGSPPTPPSIADPPDHLCWWLEVAPASLAAHLRSLAASVRARQRALALDLERCANLAAPAAPAPTTGRALFPVLLEHADVSGALIPVDSGRLTGRETDEVAARVRAWVGRLVDAPDHPALASVDLQPGLAPGLQIAGASYELAAAIAVLSRLLEKPPAAVPVLSGRLGEGRAEVLPIDGAEAKRGVARIEAPGARCFIADTPRDASPLIDELFGPDWSQRLLAALASQGHVDAREAVRAWRRFYATHSALSASATVARSLDRAEHALASGVGGSDRIQALWVRGAMLMHRGETARALADLEAARVALAAAPRYDFERWTLEEQDALLGVALLDLGRPADAVTLLTADLARLEAGVADDRDRRWHEVRLQVAGSLARALGMVGELDRAVTTLRSSLETSPIGSQRARSLMDLAELERRRGDIDAARLLLAEAREALDAIPDERSRAHTERFLALYEARAGARLTGSDPTPVEPPRWGDWPQPAEILETLLEGPEPELLAWLDANISPGLSGLGHVWLFVLLGALSRARSTASLSWLRDLADGLLARGGLDDATRSLAERTVSDPGSSAASWARQAPY